MDWPSTQEEIRKRRPPWEPLRPIRLYFISVAPPWGGAYFWDETKPDAVREGLFSALRERLGVAVQRCPDFRDLRLFPPPAARPVEVWINPPETRTTEETRGLAAARSGVLDRTKPGQLLSAHRSDLHWPSCLETPA